MTARLAEKKLLRAHILTLKEEKAQVGTTPKEQQEYKINPDWKQELWRPPQLVTITLRNHNTLHVLMIHLNWERTEKEQRELRRLLLPNHVALLSFLFFFFFSFSFSFSPSFQQSVLCGSALCWRNPILLTHLSKLDHHASYVLRWCQRQEGLLSPGKIWIELNSWIVQMNINLIIITY